MKYGESLFDIVYLLFVIISGIILLSRSNKKITKLMGISALVLGIGDSFHLIPRCMNYFINYDFTAYLGIGKLITSITMTIFYILVLFIIKEISGKDLKKESILIYILTVCRIVLCLLPQNNWLTDNSSYAIGIIRNIPFFVLGALIIKLLADNRKMDNFKNLWTYVLLSFIFYAIVVFTADYIPLLGMFMIPKTICYILMIATFNNYAKKLNNK